MSKERLETTFNETTTANAKTEIDACIDRIWAAVGASQDNIALNLTMYITASDDTNNYTFRFNPVLYDTTSTLLKAMFAAFITGTDAVIVASAFDAISAVYGRAVITLEY